MSDKNWLMAADSIHTFATVLHRAGVLDTVDDVLYFFEKPWKWDNEYDKWVEFGQPLDEHDDNWHPYVEKCGALL